MSVTVGDICDVFFSLEAKYDLNHREIQGCFAWQLIRMYLYYDITRRTGTFGAPQQKSLSVFDKVKSFAPFVKNSILSNPFSGSYTRDILIFDHPRKVLFEGQFRDIHSYFLVDLIKDDMSFDLLEAPYLNKHFTDRKDYIKYTDRIQLGSYLYKKRNKVEFSSEEKELISTVRAELESAFNLDINLEWILTIHILNFRYDYRKYAELFKKRNPERIFVVVAYENQGVVGAAKDLGIEVIELQHGTITDYHLGYSYPPQTRAGGKIAYFPDKILTFGDYWINEDTSPISRENIIPIGFPYFEAQSKDFVGIEPKRNQVLFISQGVIGKYLSKIAYEFACKMKDYDVVYKLHPGEYDTWRENYPELSNDLDNFRVIDNSETPLYQLFAESGYQVGAFSTAIYEGLMFNCTTFILDVPGVEYLSDLINGQYVCKVDDVNGLIGSLETFTPKEYDKNFFFKSLDEDLLRDVIYNG
jgi:hypothetical protein